MNFGPHFIVVLVFIALFDGLWLFINTTFEWGLYYALFSQEKDKSCSKSLWKTGLCLLCWSISALYIVGHSYSSDANAFLEGMWLGSLVYGVFNLTTVAVTPSWSSSFYRPYVDTLWGTLLFGCAAVFSYGVL